MGWLQHLFSSNRQDTAKRAQYLHAAIVEKARSPELYGQDLISDTLEGRFNAIALYAALVLPRLEQAGQKGQDLAKALNDRLFSEVDGALRETGVGDASIARKIRKMGESFVGVGQAVDRALKHDAPVENLAGVIMRNGIAPQAGARSIAKTLHENHIRLRRNTDDDMLAGRISW